MTVSKIQKNNGNNFWNFERININGIKLTDENAFKLPLCSTQKSIWATQKLYPESSIFNIGGYAIYNSNINREIYTRAIEQIINEHDAFCLEFIEEDSHVYQQIRQNNIYHILYNGECKSENEILNYIYNDMLTPFDLKEQMFKFVLFKVSDDVMFGVEGHLI